MRSHHPDHQRVQIIVAHVTTLCTVVDTSEHNRRSVTTIKIEGRGRGTVITPTGSRREVVVTGVGRDTKLFE